MVEGTITDDDDRDPRGNLYRFNANALGWRFGRRKTPRSAPSRCIPLLPPPASQLESDWQGAPPHESGSTGPGRRDVLGAWLQGCLRDLVSGVF